MLKMTGIRCLIAAVLMLPLSVLAAGSAELVGDEGDPMRLEWLDDGVMRMSTESEEGGYTVFRDGKIYVVVHEDGQPQVMETSGMMQAFVEMARDEGGMGEVSGVEATGEKATVAGIAGEVYSVTGTNAD